MFNPSKGAKNIKKSFVDYITTTLKFQNQELNNKFKEALEKKIAKGPFLEMNLSFKKGMSIQELVEFDSNSFSHLFTELEKNKPEKYKKSLPINRKLYLHQEKSFKLINSGHNAVITTGTGSGKTECFLLPLLNSLLKEEENGTLQEKGVRAILIYPMNALANDQMKRLRNILMKYPKITFGVYTGDTPNFSGEIQDYIDLHCNEEYPELRTPLENEMITREDMVKNPPHILCTNYAMLEYMLLTPNRFAVLKDSKIKFVILDEAHTYSGSTGMETALLIRRLLAHLSNNNNQPQYILTSATLGKQYKDEAEIVKFAHNLTGGNFEQSDIVFSEREYNFDTQKQIEYPSKLFCDLANSEENNAKEIFQNYNLNYNEAIDYNENLYNLCSSAKQYHILRNKYNLPVEIDKVAEWFNWNLDDTICFLHVCSLSNKNNTPLVDMRYHFFLRALEGLYHSFVGNNELFLERREYVVNGDDLDKVFEISVCKNCGDLAIVGHIEKIKGIEYLVSKEKSSYSVNSFDDDSTYFHILKKDKFITSDNNETEYDEVNDDEDEKELLDDDDLDKQIELEKTEIKLKDTYWLCPHCGELCLKENGKPMCNHNPSDFLLVRSYNKNVKSNKSKCLYCENGNYNRFYIGTESATSVLASSLFEELPIKKIEQKNSYGGFQVFDAGKQFLSFSDSRGEAAYFNSYVDQRFESLIAKRAFVKMCEKVKDVNRDNWTLINYSHELKSLFKKDETFSDDLLKNMDVNENDIISEKKTWTIILKELMTCKRKNSLQSLGFLKFEYLGNQPQIVEYYQAKFLSHLNEYEVKSFLDELAMTFAYFGAIKIPNNVHLDIEDIKNIFWTANQKAISISKTDHSTHYIGSWLPMSRLSDPSKYYKTYRLELTLNTLQTNDVDKAIILLREYFDFLTNNANKYCAESIGTGKSEFAMPIDRFTLKLPTDSVVWYICNKCGKITTTNINNSCSILKCDGKLEKIDHEELLNSKNYYREFYSNNHSECLKKLIIKEHTAQLSKKDAANYQVSFEKNHINALSCSTTFEMGVDVGELETVFLRDIPPSAANYSQRAGRAGRSQKSSAFVLSYAKLSSHDFSFFNNPINMINGKINPPLFRVNNKKIVYRHIYSTLFGYFFNKYPHHFEDEDKKQRNLQYFFENIYDSFIDMIKNPSLELVELLHKSFFDIDEELGISTFSNEWVDDLIGMDGRLTNAYKDYQDNIKDFDEQLEYFNSLPSSSFKKGGASKKYQILGAIAQKKERYQGLTIITFLVNANILPKYGFPVDTVELRVDSDSYYNAFSKNNTSLRLNRDLMQAISDYAPGSKVIANDRMYTSRYISKYWKNGNKDFDEIYVCKCLHCKTMNISYINPEGKTDLYCIGCNSKLPDLNWESAIHPVAGMIAENNKGEKVPLTRPKKMYRSEYYFVEKHLDSSRQVLDVGERKITIISSNLDNIVVTSSLSQPFYVCKKCGMSFGIFDKIRDKNNNLDKAAMDGIKKNRGYISVKYHENPTKAECNNHLFDKRLLFHSFNTDIVQILFNDNFINDESKANSILYSLIDAIANVLDVEKKEIAGVAQFIYNSNLNTDYRFVLFDNVPGGAGHVKRLLQNNFIYLHNVINYAYNKAFNCSCDETTSCYSCLRTYDNQRIHNQLVRKHAYSFFENYKDVIPSLHENKELIIKSMQKNPYGSWDSLFNVLDSINSNLFDDKVKIIVKSKIPLPTHLFPTISIDGENDIETCSLYWENGSVFLFSKNDKNFVNNCPDFDLYNFFVGNYEINIEELASRIKKGG